MQNEKEIKRRSKFLSLILRHRPELIGLTMDSQGWVNVEDLLGQLKKHRKEMTMDELQEIVVKNNKKRFTFSDDLHKIRASQGHSVNIDLGYTSVEPPEFLYHGTATRFIDSIKKMGLDKRNRHHVHLSSELDTATSVGSRHGKVIILSIKSKEMHDAGFEFFFTKNKVWLTDYVPVSYISFP